MEIRQWLENRTEVQDADEGEVLICCPFHGETNPSLSVNLGKGVFHCFACKESGNFIKLVAEFDGLSYDQARALVQEGEGDDLLLKSMLDGLLEDEEEVVQMPFSRKAFHKLFPAVSEAGLNYLYGRNISRETAERFDLRWGVKGIMQGRVVFPVYNTEGKLTTYGGRAITQDVQPKTRKARSGLSGFYGLWELVKDTHQRRPLILVEGEFDAMYLQQCGYPAISTMGTAGLTEGQRVLLKRYASLVVWSYDGDDAGRKAQAKGVLATRRFVPTIGVNLPDGSDPNELTVKQVDKIYGGIL